MDALEPYALASATDVPVVGTVPKEISVDVPAHTEVLVQATNRGIVAVLEVLGNGSTLLAHSENPVRRYGSAWAIVLSGDARHVVVRLTGKEHADLSGRVVLHAYAFAEARLSSRCARTFRALAAADTAYAKGQDIARLEAPAGAGSERHFYLTAVEEYLLAAKLLDGPPDAPLRSLVELAIAAAYYQDVHNWTVGAEWATRAQASANAVRLDYAASRAGALLANCWINFGPGSTYPGDPATRAVLPRVRFERARELLQRLGRFHRRRGELYDAALALSYVGVAYTREGDYRAAEAVYRRAGIEFGALHEWPQQGWALSGVGFAQWGRGDLPAAEISYREALEELKTLPGPAVYLNTLANSGLISFALGDYDESLRVNAEALRISRAAQSKIAEAASLYGLGVTYYALGDRAIAKQYLEESLVLRPASLDTRSRLATLRALSNVYRDAGNMDAALAADEEALSLATSAPSRERMLIRVGVDQGARGRFAEALHSLATALGEGRAEDPVLTIEALIARGHVFRVGGKPESAADDLRRALGVISHHDDPDLAFQANVELAQSWAALNRPDEALSAIDRALARADEIRRQSASPEFRAQRQALLRPAYDVKLALLADRYRKLEAAGDSLAAERISVLALGTADHERAQSLADVSSLTYARDSAILRDQLGRREHLYREMAAQRYQLESREESGEAGGAGADALRSEISSIGRELDSLNIAIAQESGVRSGSRVASPADWRTSLRKQASDAVLVEYWLGAHDAYAWTISQDGIHWSLLGESAPITDAARVMHEAFRGYSGRALRDRREAGTVLYDRIIRPLGEAANGGRPLTVVPDGALSYVPFAALRTGREAGAQYLIQQHDIAMAPAVWWLMDRRPRTPAGRPSRILLVSDPIYSASDERLTSLGRQRGSVSGNQSVASDDDRHQFEGLKRLPWTAREAELIAGLVPASDLDQFSGAGATRARVLAVDWPAYRVIHLASHGMVDAGMPQLSALVLGAYDDRGQRVEQALRAADIETLSLRADVVSLSACDTALGREIAGEGAVGLAYTTLARGAGAVLGSLWQAPDEMSARLMTEFYRGLLDVHRSPSKALGAAMRAVLEKRPEADPAFWAMYQLSVSHLDEKTVGQATSTSDAR